MNGLRYMTMHMYILNCTCNAFKWIARYSISSIAVAGYGDEDIAICLNDDRDDIAPAYVHSAYHFTTIFLLTRKEYGTQFPSLYA